MSFSTFDHILQVLEPATEPIQVPCRSRMRYDGLGFSDYPERRGWDKDKLMEGDFQGKPRSEVESFIQTWLFFGTLVEVFAAASIEVDQNSFVFGNAWITFGPLKKLVSKWMTSLKDLPEKAKRDQASRIRNCIAEVHRFSERRFSGARVLLSPVSYEIELSIIFLGNSLDSAAVRLLDLDDKDFKSAFGNWNRGWGSIRWTPPYNLENTLIMAGWSCAYQIALLKRDYSIPSLLLLSLLGLPDIGIDHLECTPTVCKMLQVDEDLYTPNHCGDCEDDSYCPLISVNGDELSDLINGGHIPLVRLEYVGSTGGLRIIVTNKSEIEDSGTDSETDSDLHTVPYIAISHVWGHGLGNPERNGLPTCQLRRIKEFVEKTAAAASSRPIGTCESSPFWLDTLCIPVGKEFKAQRKIAITRMGEIYKEAPILVLDSYLEAVHSPATPTEGLFRLGTSDWMKRLWTFQEGVLGYNNGLWVAFSDRVVNMKPHINRSLQFPEHEVHFFVSPIAADAASPFFNISHLAGTSMKAALRNFQSFIKSARRNRITKSECISLLAEGLAGRATSRAGDEAICIASILKVDVEDLIDLPDNERMQMLYTKLGKVPPGLLFMPEPKLQSDGFRWAPSTFLGRFEGTAHDLILESAVQLDGQLGLPISYSGYQIAGDVMSTERLFLLDEESGIWHMVVQQAPPRLVSDWPRKDPMADDFIPDFINPPEMKEVRNPVLFLRSYAFSLNLCSNGAIATVTGSSGNALQARFVALVVVYRLNWPQTLGMDKEWPFLEDFKLSRDLQNKKRVIAIGKRSSPGQRWYVA